MPAPSLDTVFLDEVTFKTAIALLRNSSLGNLVEMSKKLSDNIQNIKEEIRKLNLNKSKIIRTKQKLDDINVTLLGDINTVLKDVNGKQITAYQKVLKDLDNGITDVNLVNLVKSKVGSAIQDLLADNYVNTMKKNSIEYASLKLDKILSLYDLKIDTLTKKKSDLGELLFQIQSSLVIKDRILAKDLILSKVIFLDIKSIEDILTS